MRDQALWRYGNAAQAFFMRFENQILLRGFDGVTTELRRDGPQPFETMMI